MKLVNNQLFRLDHDHADHDNAATQTHGASGLCTLIYGLAPLTSNSKRPLVAAWWLLHSETPFDWLEDLSLTFAH